MTHCIKRLYQPVSRTVLTDIELGKVCNIDDQFTKWLAMRRAMIITTGLINTVSISLLVFDKSNDVDDIAYAFSYFQSFALIFAMYNWYTIGISAMYTIMISLFHILYFGIRLITVINNPDRRLLYAKHAWPIVMLIPAIKHSSRHLAVVFQVSVFRFMYYILAVIIFIIVELVIISMTIIDYHPALVSLSILYPMYTIHEFTTVVYSVPGYVTLPLLFTIIGHILYISSSIYGLGYYFMGSTIIWFYVHTIVYRDLLVCIAHICGTRIITFYGRNQVIQL